MLPLTAPSSVWLRRIVIGLAWTLLIWIVVFLRLGYPSFWDPGDEAHYAQATKEMLASADWLVPRYNGQPFFDKPILFYLLQLTSFRLFGATELAARLVPACSALMLFAAVGWLGRTWFGTACGALAVLMLGLVPATFALSSYAILDMTFTAFLFGGAALVAAAALDGRPRLQYAGYVLLALAVLTKGPLALALSGLTVVVAALGSTEIRRALLRLRWVTGLGLIAAVSLPWFVYMWWRFGYAFVEGYLLRENLWLYTRPLFGPSTKSPLFALRVVVIGLWPWTPILIGRIVDIARGDRATTREGLLWAWAGVTTAFFTFSHFTLDHYLYPVAPALCLLTADAWSRLRRADSLRAHAGALVGVSVCGLSLVVAGGVGAWLARDMVAWAAVGALTCAAGGASLLFRFYRNGLRPPALPLGPAGGLLALYAIVLIVALPEIELAKPAKDLAQGVAAALPADHVATYNLDRWTTSVHFYADRSMLDLDTPKQVDDFLRTPGAHYFVMPRTDYDDLAPTARRRLRIVHERLGVNTVTARIFRRDRRLAWRSFVVATDAPRD